MSRMITTFFGAGLAPVAPGTFGSLAALPTGYGLHVLGGPVLLSLGVVLAFFVGLWATKVETAGKDDHDPSEIVIDEVAGQWIALMPLSIGLSMAGAAPHVFPWPGWVGAFVMFRLFDIWKPWPVSWADRKETPVGVMLDDVLAGVMAAIVVTAAAGISHGVLGQ